MFTGVGREPGASMIRVLIEKAEAKGSDALVRTESVGA